MGSLPENNLAEQREWLRKEGEAKKATGFSFSLEYGAKYDPNVVYVPISISFFLPP
jgi:hypothetical protein